MAVLHLAKTFSKTIYKFHNLKKVKDLELLIKGTNLSIILKKLNTVIVRRKVRFIY